MKKGFSNQSYPKHRLKTIILFGDKIQVLEVIN